MYHRCAAGWQPVGVPMTGPGVREHGPDVRLLAPPCVKAAVKAPKHEAREAEAICEAVSRPAMRSVPSTRVEQRDLQALHQIRERLMKARPALVNELRGLLSE